MSEQHVTRKRFGQHFLCDDGVIHAIVNAISPNKDQPLVEIGPGRGALTLPLLEYDVAMRLIEIDRDLVAWWNSQKQQGVNVEVYDCDVLRFDFNELGSEQEPIKLIGNLPYNISSPLFFHLINFHTIIKDMCFMVQKEVAIRLAAKPGEKPYNSLSVWLQLHYQIELLFDVPPEAFAPPPKVDSSIIRLQPHSTPPVSISDKAGFHKFIKACFAQKRKTLRNNLKKILDAEKIDAAGIDPSRRAETLSIEEFAALHNQLSHSE
ncbi:MAG: 16S rRNA (adenine(1518)-N(6)/adenine(1519)-N(6))-dimethyltransferase RsmA [Gammaproteobacteria bacterium]|nr:16S rRNA (adenine(1518)-N(6)/adenine(1519)-N(6))-dimethyltransferase RsmA [Gammaproteobacteria bacterium]